VVGGALFEGGLSFAYGVQVENVGDGEVVGCVVLHFEPSALVWWSAEDSQVSITQLKIGESTDIN